MHPDTVTESEIHAYLDDELDLGRRLAVEHHLACDPQAAARFMADLELRTALRMVVGNPGEPPAAMSEAAALIADRLNSAAKFEPRRLFDRPIMRLLAAAALLAVIILPGRNVLASPPDFVNDAVDAYRTGLLRAAMASQLETPRFDPVEVRRSTHIRMPRLPARWVVTDAQIFPSDQGPALQLMVNTPAEEKMSIFAVRATSDAPEEPVAVRHDGASVAYWREGDMSYALTGSAEPEELDSAAEDIAADAG